MRAEPAPSSDDRRADVDQAPKRRTWKPPIVEELPRLTDLTLQTGSAIVGGGNTGDGSTVF